MIEKKSYALLKELYKHEYMNAEDVAKITGTKAGLFDCYTDYLYKENLVAYGSSEEKVPDGEGGFVDSIGSYRITLQGRAYVETHRRNTWGFWLPYGITTGIAVVNLIALLLG